MRHPHAWTSSALCPLLVACAPLAGGGPPGTTAAGAGATREAIWTAVLEAHAARRVPTEAVEVAEVNRITGAGDSVPAERRVLLLQRGPRPSRAWLDGVVASGLVDGVCHARAAIECPDSVPTTFLTLATPKPVADSAATVMLTDQFLDPGACRRKAGVFMTGSSHSELELRRRDGKWRVVAHEPRMHGSGFCGATPEEDARVARLRHEDSLLRTQPSLIAGTYRVTVTFATGDSSVVFTRTVAHPTSSLRRTGITPRTEDDADRPIVGYYLMAYSAPTLDSLPPPHRVRNMQSYYAIAVSPVAIGPDSSTWRGEVAPIVEVALLDPRPEMRALAEQLFGADDVVRDSAWYFLPATWVLHADGRATFDWTVGPDSAPAYRVRATRISTRTAPDHSRR